MRRVGVALAVLVVLAGCSGALHEQPDTSIDDTGDGQFTGEVVPEAPPNATAVNYTDERVQANEYLREVVRKAGNESADGYVGVPDSAVEETKADLAELPLYTIEESESSEYDWGYYVRYEGTVVRVVFAVLD
ncbi:hypothetical protein [Halorussus litoreus]|uniref:hypothetical protein n=1 Tax=Halorussus litoreus TaxID=1710536 RepID=UPI0013009457|nr:hypothetical protein [Halorussus litoreus]